MKEEPEPQINAKHLLKMDPVSREAVVGKAKIVLSSKDAEKFKKGHTCNQTCKCSTN